MGSVFVYPTPILKPSYTLSSTDSTLLFIPQKIQKSPFCPIFCLEPWFKSISIPCRYIQYPLSSSSLIISFHENGEDIERSTRSELCYFSQHFCVDALCPEYPTYGRYKEKDDSLTMEEAMLQDARTVITYCHTKLQYKLEDILLVGRSLGTGPAVRMATEYKVRGLVLISPFTSIRDVAKKLVGSFLAKLVPDEWRNVDYIDKIKCPVLFIHGEKDTLTPLRMSIELHERTKMPKTLRVSPDKAHNDVARYSDLIEPMWDFINEHLILKESLLPEVDKIVDKGLYEAGIDIVKGEEIEDSKQEELAGLCSYEGSIKKDFC